MNSQLPGWSRLLSLALGIGLGFAVYSQITLEGVLRQIDPDVTPLGREYNDGVAIRELFREAEDPEALVFYLVGGSSAVRGVDAELFAFTLTQRLGRSVVARSLTSYRQSIVDTESFLSLLPNGEPGRSFVIYTWAGVRLQRNLTEQVADALNYRALPLRSDLVESYRSYLRDHTTAFFGRTPTVPEDPRCGSGEVEPAALPLGCLLTSPANDDLRDFLLRPGIDRSIGTTSLVTALFTGLSRPRAVKNLPAVPRPVTQAGIDQTAQDFERAFASIGSDPSLVERLKQQLGRILDYDSDRAVDVSRNAALLAGSLQRAERLGYQVLLYESPIWQGAMEEADFVEIRERSRRVARLAAQQSGVSWLNQDGAADRREAFLYEDALHPNLYGKFLDTIELADVVGDYLTDHGDLVRP